jgi:hypothetical protein
MKSMSIFALALLALASLPASAARPRMGGGACPAPEATVNAGTKMEFCAASADHQCAAGRVLKHKGSLELCVNAPPAPAHKPRMGGGACPAPEATVNAGTKMEFCAASADHQCAAGHVLKRKGSLELCVSGPAHPRLGG